MRLKEFLESWTYVRANGDNCLLSEDNLNVLVGHWEGGWKRLESGVCVLWLGVVVMFVAEKTVWTKGEA